MKHLFKLFFIMIAASLAVISCKDCEPEPPVVEEIVNTYTNTTLKATIDGQPATDGAEIKIMNDAANGLMVELVNIIPETSRFEIPNIAFETATKAYVSRISGERTDMFIGKTVAVQGVVDGKVLTMTVTTKQITSEPATDAASLALPYKGDMKVKVSGADVAPMLNKFVYLLAPGKSGLPAAVDPTRIKLQLKNFIVEGIDLKTVTVDTIPVTKRGDVYLLNTSQQTVKLQTLGDALVDIKGRIVAGVMDMKLKLTIPSLENKVVELDFVGEERRAIVEKITIDSDVVIEQPVDMGGGAFKFTVSESTPDEKLVMLPVVQAPKGAVLRSVKLVTGYEERTIDLATPIDFSTGSSVQYNYVAEGETAPKTTTLEIVKINTSIATKFPFDSWDVVVLDENTNYDTPAPQNVLATSNKGAMFLQLFGPIGFPVLKTDDAKAGAGAAKLVTLDTRGMWPGMIPAVTSGSVFMGQFELDMEQQLKSTKFGVEFDKKPLRFKGYYKYKGGDEYVDGTNGTAPIVVPGKKDEFSINAVLYEVSHYAETLTGLDIHTSDRIVAMAAVADGTDKAEYTAFDIEFKWVNGKTYNKQQKYKLAFICSSSKEGDAFKGAPGSTLYIDEFEIVAE